MAEQLLEIGLYFDELTQLPAFRPDSEIFYIHFSSFFYNTDSSEYYCYNGRMQ